MSTYNEKNSFDILQCYFDKYGKVNHQLNSFNWFLNFGIQDVIDKNAVTVIKADNRVIKITLGQITIANPVVIEENRKASPLYPYDARIRNLTYDANVYCDIMVEIEMDGKVEKVPHHRVNICQIPIMVKSERCNLNNLITERLVDHNECHMDPGGYFIIDGYERVIVSQFRNSHNIIMVSHDHKPEYRDCYVADIRSMSYLTGHSDKIDIVFGNDKRQIYVNFPSVKGIPLGIVFKAYGYSTWDEFKQLIGIDDKRMDKYINYIWRDAFHINNREEALETIGRQSNSVGSSPIEQARQMLENDTFPHFGIASTNKERSFFMGLMARKLFATVLGLRNINDKDNLANKRVDCAGELYYEIFRNSIKTCLSDLKKKFKERKETTDVVSYLSKELNITQNIKKCMNSGDWVIKKTTDKYKTGVSQILDRMTYASSISHLRRIVFQTFGKGKVSIMRQIHPSQYGYICPSETPEGANVGMVLNFSLTAKVTTAIPLSYVRTVLDTHTKFQNINNVELTETKDLTSLLINGILYGFTNDPYGYVDQVKHLRQKKILDHEVSVAYDIVDNEIAIFCDSGRFIRPLLTVDNDNLLIQSQDQYNWDQLIEKGVIQFVDPREVESAVIAMYPDNVKTQTCDLCEIHPVTMFGVMAAAIPFPDHSQSPRNCYQCSMGKQALGTPLYTTNIRTDTILHVLSNAQRPIVTTKINTIIGNDKMPSGVNAIVAIASYTGFNQEDSIIVNKSAMERGFCNLITYKTIVEVEDNKTEHIGIPPQSYQRRKKGGPDDRTVPLRNKGGNYNLLDENGVIKVHTDIKWYCDNDKCRKMFNDTKLCQCGVTSSRSTNGKRVRVRKGDVLIGKTITYIDKNENITMVDSSRIVQDGEDGVIDNVYIITRPNGQKVVKVVIRKYRVPEVGDKFASRAAQKGTIGRVVDDSEMPFTATGIKPDIVINPLCLGPNTNIKLQDHSSAKISEIVQDADAYTVQTICPKKFAESSTKIHAPFAIKPTKKMVRVKTWSGREVVCTADHPFLVGPNEWKNACDLVPNQDMLTIMHTTEMANTTGEIPDLDLTHSLYPQLKNFKLDEAKLQILARMLGALESDGHICYRNQDKLIFRCRFHLGEMQDAEDFNRDVETLGFTTLNIRKCTSKINGSDYQTTYNVEVTASLAFIFYRLGASIGRKSACAKMFPKWLKTASSEVKRQFLSGIQGGDGSYIGVNEPTTQQQVRIRPTKMTAHVDVLKYHIAYMNEIKNLFSEFGIACGKLSIYKGHNDDTNILRINISNANPNIERYAGLIDYSYCNHKRSRSRLPIEYVRLCNRGINVPYNKMKEFIRNDCVAMYVDSVEEIDTIPLVYDFATVSENHSFVANSIVVHNCMPSRMTINQLIESFAGKACSISLTMGDATPFTQHSINAASKLVEENRQMMLDNGLDPTGYEQMYNGFTGEPFAEKTYIGVVYYQRLKHIVDDKIHARQRGSVTVLTRQPLEGRSRGGGLRFGEMERDCVITHGTTRMLLERTFDVSDEFYVYICTKCGMFANNTNFCACSAEVVKAKMPYAAKIMFQDIMTAGIKVRFKVGNIVKTLTDESEK